MKTINLPALITIIFAFICNISNAQLVSFPISDSTYGVTDTIELYISFSDSVYNSNGTALTNTNVGALVNLIKGGEDGTPVSFNATINNRKDSIFISLTDGQLEESSEYYFAIENGITSNSGAIPATSITFFTEDNTLPTAQYSISDNATNISDTISITITFSEDVTYMGSTIDYGNINSVFELQQAVDGYIACDYTINTTSDTFKVQPASPLNSKTTYNLIVMNVQDMASNVMPNDTLTFTIADLTGPQATMFPSNEATNISVNTSLSIKFDEGIRSINNTSLTSTSIDTMLVLKKNNASGADVPFDASINASKDSISIILLSALMSEETYYFGFADSVFEDSYNNVAASTYVTFTAEDNGPIVTFYPVDGRDDFPPDSAIELSFNKSIRNNDDSDIDADDIQNFITLREGDQDGSDVYFNGSINLAKDRITITPTNGLADEQTYYLAISADVENQNNKLVVAQSITFTTKDGSEPQISFYPADSNENIPADTLLYISFDEPVRKIDDSELVDGDLTSIVSLNIDSINGSAVAFSASINAEKTLITINPISNFKGLTNYYLSINSVEDEQDNQTVLSGISFITEPLGATVTFLPINGSIDVDVNGNITITFNEPVTLSGGAEITNANVDSLITLKVSDENGADVAFDATIDGTKQIVTVNPDAALSSEEVYYVSIGMNFYTASMEVNECSWIQFTTADVIAPTFSFTPINGSTNIFWNNSIIIEFDEPIRNSNDSEINSGNISSFIEFERVSDNNPLSFTAEINTEKTTIEITPDINIQELTEYKVIVLASIEDDADNTVVDDSMSYTTSRKPDLIEVDPNDGLKLDDIQAAVDSAEDFDTILIAPATYNEGIYIDIPLILISERYYYNDGSTLPILTKSSGDENIIYINNVQSEYMKILGLEFKGQSLAKRGIWLENSQLIADSLYIHHSNLSSYGGGMFINNNSTAYISNSTISNNSANGGGGVGVFNNSYLEIENCYLNNNIAKNGEHGGAIRISESECKIINSMLYNNSADNAGGGICIEGNYNGLTVIQSTITQNENNTGGYGAGIHWWADDNNSYIIIKNSIIDGNNNTGDNAEFNISNHTSGSQFNIAHSFVGRGQRQDGNWYEDGVAWPGEGNVSGNPKFTDPDSDDYTLTEKSLALGAGDETIEDLPSYDITGATRIQGGTRPDMGALENALNQPNLIYNEIAHNIENMSRCSFDWGDYDADGDFDLAVSGYKNGSSWVKVYKNSGSAFTEAITYEDKYNDNNAWLEWIDYDNDGDLDLFERSNSNKLYRNNGDGTLTKVRNFNLPNGNMKYSYAWADYDVDGDMDLMVIADCWHPFILENSNGNFIERSINEMTNLHDRTSVAVADYDNDGLTDVLITGKRCDDNTTEIIYLYKNIGNFNFSKVNTGFYGTRTSNGEFVDFDSDGDLDIVLYVENESDNQLYTLLFYVNNNNNFVSAEPGIDSIPRFDDSPELEWADINNDGYLDLITFDVQDYYDYTNFILYINNQNNTFSEVETDIELNNAEIRDIEAADYDNDGVKELIYMERNNSGEFIHIFNNNTYTANNSPSVPSNLFEVQNNGTYTLSWDIAADNETPQEAISYNLKIGTTSGGSDILSVNALSNGTLLKQGNGNIGSNNSYNFKPIAGLTYYWTVQSIDMEDGSSAFAAEQSFTAPGPVTLPSSVDFASLKARSAAWGDYESDGDMDIVVISTNNEIKIYKNESNTIDVDNPVYVNVNIGEMEFIDWVDYDIDGDLDLYVIENNENIRLLKNNAGTFNLLSTHLGYVRLITGTKWFDIDSDGDLDLLTTRDDWLRIYYNKGNDTFDEDYLFNIPNVNYERGSIDIKDFDNDGDYDILLSGIVWYHNYQENRYLTKILENNDGNFTEISMNGIQLGMNAKWVDYDLDSDLDLFVIGVLTETNDSSYSILYNNTGGTYVNSGLSFEGLNGGISDIKFEDYDNDGDLDFIYWSSETWNGDFFWDITSENKRFTAYYYENNLTSFTKYDIGIHDARIRNIDLVDYNNDGDLDILMASRNGLKLFDNEVNPGNTVPAIPSGLSATVNGSSVVLSWNKVLDTEDASGKLTGYNIMVGTSINQADIIKPVSNITDGSLLLPQKGLINDTSYSIELEGGRQYYWAVQSVDGIYASSAFATSDSFVIEGTYFTKNDINAEGIRPAHLRGTVRLGDYDNDSDLDILQFGQHISYNKTISFINNDGGGIFTEIDKQNEFENLTYNEWDIFRAEWVDFDSDNDLDISLIQNHRNYTYKNDGGTYIQKDYFDRHIAWDATEWTDIDNDGDIDLILHEGNIIAYINDGKGNFSELNLAGWDNQTNTNLFENFDNSRAGLSVFDIDNDGVKEIVSICMLYSTYKFIVLDKKAQYDYNSKIQEIDLGIETTELQMEAIDYDNDGDLDIIASFHQGDFNRQGYLYLFENNSGVFTSNEINLGDYDNYGEFDIGDLDNDGDIDLVVVTGNNTNNDFQYQTRLFLNENGVFNYFKSGLEQNIYNNQPQTLTVGDLDNDNKLDVVISGELRNGGRILQAYYNNTENVNTTPSQPVNLQSSVNGSKVTISWDEVVDADISGISGPQQPLISYNIKLGTTSGGSDIINATANADGSILVPQSGAFTSNSFEFIAPSGKTYYWSVQAIDAGYKGSSFSDESSFTIEGPSFNLSKTLDNVDAKYSIWGDIDNDEDLDILMLTNERRIEFYENDGANNFDLTNLNFDQRNDNIELVKLVDFDNDNDLDIYASRNQNHRLYTNNNSDFTYESINLGWAEQDVLGNWIYFDEDGKNDLVTLDGNSLKIYKLIDGQVRDQNIWFDENLYGLKHELADYDNDDDLDLLISGYRWDHDNQDYLSFFYLYRNEGIDGYVRTLINQPSSYAAKWIDIDLDGDEDIFSVGHDSSILYINNSGVFDQQINNFDGYKGSTFNLEWSRSYRFGIESADLDNNGTIDLIYWTPDKIYFYMNNDSVFQNYLPVIGVSGINNIDIADIDNDGDIDFMVNANNVIKVYENTTSIINTPPSTPELTAPNFDGSTVEINWSPSDDVETNTTSISYNLRIGSTQGGSDILSPEAHSNGLLLKPAGGNLGKDTTHSLIVKAGTKIYYSIQAVDPNYSASLFSDEDSLVVPGSPFTPVDVSFSNDLLQDIAWGDYDKDEDLDIISLTVEKDSMNMDMFGNMPDINKVRVYLNNGGVLSKTNKADFVSEGESYINSAYWLDYDGDDDLDIFVKRDGRDILYRRDSSVFNRIDNFITNDNWHFQSNDISFGDFDNDGDLDLLYKKDNRVVLLRNHNNIRYDEVQVDLTQVIEGSEFYYVNLYNSVAEFGDYDNDGDFDILVAGDGEYYKPENNEWVNIKYVNLLNNNGKGEFNKVEANITGEDVKKIEWIDFDNDGDLDIFLRFADRDYYDPAVAQDKTYKLYRNNNGVFENIIVDLKGVGNINDAAWGDFDNDGDLDLAIRGQYRFNDWDLRYKISLYMNKGDGTFSYIYTDVDDISFVHGSSSMAWGDYDNDGDLDLIVSGRADYDNSVITKIFRNDYSVPNSPPNAPTNLSARQDGYKLTFSWDPATDDENGTDGLTYNLRVGTTNGGSDILSAHVTPGEKLLMPGKGNVENNTSFSINTLNLSNAYFWSVQAVDAGYAASEFTDDILVAQEPFLERTDVELAEVKNGTSAWGDYDNDGDLDLLITGASNSGYVSNLYRNDDGVFVNTTTLLKRMASGDAAWGDYDNDGDLDLIMTGSDVYANASTVIYINEGNGVLTESTVADNITQVFNSALAWGDYDDDGDLDLAIAGYSIEERSDIFHLFKNENGEFVREEGFNGEGFENGNLEWADMDNDGDVDLVYSGMNNSLMPAGGIIYNNKIENNYWWGDIFNQGFNVMNSVFDLGDYDSDGDLDILISGEMDNGIPATYIMKNRVINRYRDDNYNEFETAPLDSVMNSSVAWGDYDNDGDLDILLCGERADATLITKLLNNMGNELFIDVNIGLLEGVKDGFVAWGDVENDGDLDLIFTGSTGVGYVSKFIESNMGNEINVAPDPPINLSYQHDGFGKITLTWDRANDEETVSDALNYNIRLGTSNAGNELSVIHAASDGTRILPAIGKANANTWELNLEPGTYYWSVQSIDGNKQGSVFSTENTITLDYEWMNLSMKGIVDRTIQGETEGELEWADFDSDGDLDLAVIGNNNSRIYENRLDYFVEIWSGGKYGKGDLAWGDYDNDGDLDLVIAGDQSNRNPRTAILKNDNGNFYEANYEFNFIAEFNPNFYDFEGIYDGNISWLDFDNDGDLDLILAGLNGANQSILKMYKFERDTDNIEMINVHEISTELPPVQNGGFTFGDYDNDEDLDLAFMGFSGMTGLVTQLYQNNDNEFTAVDIELPGVENGAIEFADYDNDGDLDIFLAGDGVSSTITTILQNNYPENSFTNIQPELTAVNSCNVSWGDYDGDGDLDLAYSGRSLGLGGITKIYQNDTTNGFIDVSFDLSDFNDANMAWGDYDDDDDLDLVITGQASSGEGSIFKVYKNVIPFQDTSNLKSYSLKAVDRPKNKPPNVPSRLKSAQGDSPTNIRFTWDPSEDDNTNSPGLTYALRIGTTPGGSEIMSANAISDGTRKLAGKGNVEHNLSWNIDLKPGRYYWAVQAIDAAFSGSVFSEEQVVVVSGTGIEANNAPTNIALNNDKLPEDSPIGTLLGYLTTEDADNLDAHYYQFKDSIGGEDNSAFTIINDSVYTTINFNYNTQNTYSILIESFDQGGLSYVKPFVIYIDTALSSISYAPHKINIDNASVNERSPYRTLVGTLSAEDVNPDDIHTFRLVEKAADNDQFIIDGNELLTANIFEYDNQSSYNVLIETEDSEGLTYEETITIYVISSSINYAPTDISFNAFDLYESNPAGTVAGYFTAEDENTDDEHTFELVDGVGSSDNNSFYISGNELMTAKVLNYDEKQQYSIHVRATDEGGLEVSKSFTVDLIEVTGINNNLLNGYINIYPNPMTDKVLIIVDPKVGKSYTLSIFDSKGDKLFTKMNINDSEFELKREELTQGILFIQIISQSGDLYNSRLIVK